MTCSFAYVRYSTRLTRKFARMKTTAEHPKLCIRDEEPALPVFDIYLEVLASTRFSC